MPTCLTKRHLRRLRNEIDINDLIADVLQVEHRFQEGRFRFLCPLCSDFNTATNPKTNLARCFRCKKNFNPIDMTMIVKRYAFLDAVAFLDPMLR
jgi:DNA primase